MDNRFVKYLVKIKFKSAYIYVCVCVYACMRVCFSYKQSQIIGRGLFSTVAVGIVTITILDSIQHPVFHLKEGFSETGLWLTVHHH
jgi:hypothetical protein